MSELSNRNDRGRAGPLLVIGCGSELRGDDAVGRRVAELAAEWERPDVQVMSVHQLAPELAEAISAARAVVFVDADISGSLHAPELRPLRQGGASVLGHTGDPAGLMDLTAAVYGRRPEAWLLAIPVSDIDMRMSLSGQAESALTSAMCELVALAHRCGIGLERTADYA